MEERREREGEREREYTIIWFSCSIPTYSCLKKKGGFVEDILNSV